VLGLPQRVACERVTVEGRPEAVSVKPPKERAAARSFGHQLEDGVGAESVGVILVLVVGQDAIDAGPDHLQERVLGKMRVAGVTECLGKRAGQADALIELADRQQSGISGELPRRRLDHERCAEKVEALGPGNW
jgi:hypothetical protein